MQGFYDSHVHTCHSPDSQQPFWEICETALAKGLRGIAITDHAEMWLLGDYNVYESIGASIADAKAADARYGDKLRVFCGVELAEMQDDPETANRVLSMTNYDVVIGSVHSVFYEEWQTFYSAIDFGKTSEEKLKGFMEAYFKKLLHLAQTADFDVLAHLTCPLRYINGKYHRNLSIQPHQELIQETLRTILRREKALEVNTSGLQSFYGDLLPGREILAQYYAMGGRLITLGGDAHTADRLANGFEETASVLKEIGFQGYFYYDQRKPHWVSWD